jgi:hypothetical protein
MPLSPLLLSLTLFHFASAAEKSAVVVASSPALTPQAADRANLTIHPPAARVVLKITDSYFSS